ncbi:MAG TPA: 23S rRNA (uracil(1939)-C(5))-methyltransferase RlmD [Patescibacteria group bacterium]|nr:23S rRNA (uracil(1939)-C(5))-methyltransferase RlmD [Patescibacteria group bacterium]
MKENRDIPVKIGQDYMIDIEGLGHSGEGVGRKDGFTVFVPMALPGERVAVRIKTVKKQYAVAELQEILVHAAERSQPPCPVYQACGGCQLQHLSYNGQLTVKQQQVINAMARIAHLPEIPVHSVLGAVDCWHYRNKMQFPVGVKKGVAVIGCYAAGTHNVIDTRQCLIQQQANNQMAVAVKDLVEELKINVYDELTGQGILRHILGRVGTASGEVMAVLITATDNIPHKEQIIAGLQARVPGLVSICQNVNSRRTNVVMGEKTRVLWGQETISDRLGEFSFRISPRSFFQVNTVQTQVLYEKAVAFAGLTGQETVIDAYCGTGTISLFLARQAARVYGIEIVEPAIRDAVLNAENNGVENAEFIVGDAVDVMPELYHRGIRPDVVVVDPPRAGCDAKVLQTFVRMEPQRIVYVSCNPASLARDLAVLDELGYAAREIQPVDMFPQTFHVESVALVQRKHIP